MTAAWSPPAGRTLRARSSVRATNQFSGRPSPPPRRRFAMAIQAKELTKDYQYGFSDIDVSVFRTAKGLSPEVVASISQHKGEPEWMLKFRLKALDHFRKRPMPTWGADLSGLDFENIYYYVKPVEEMSRSWDDVPDSIKNTFDRLWISQAGAAFLSRGSAQD